MKILVSGSTGLIGTALLSHLREEGHEVYSLVRSRSRQNPANLFWNPDAGELDVNSLEGFDGIVHLAGESIASGRWTKKKKERIRNSRINGTALLSKTISTLKHKPSVFICASAIGFYGNRGDEILFEESSPGNGFLSDICSSWEFATAVASQSGVRVVNLRFGIVLTPIGGALPKMLLPIKLGIGGRIGSGDQYMSWVSLKDVVRIIEFSIKCREVMGPVNAVSPKPITNAEFTKVLGKELNRPTFTPLPSTLARAVLGEMANALLLASTRVHPKKLLDHGYTFSHANLAETLHDLNRGSYTSDQVFTMESWVPKKRNEVFTFFCDPNNLERITPSWLSFRVESMSTSEIKKGTEIKYRLKIHGIPVCWKSLVDSWEPDRVFSDIQLSGPYSKWHHTHRFFEQSGGTLMIDEVRYQLPGGLIGNLLGNKFVRRDIQRIFNFRKAAIIDCFKLEIKNR